MRALLALALVVPLAASAQVDIHLAPFGSIGKSGIQADLAGFKSLAGDLGQIMGPQLLGPGDTTGALGFDVGLALSVTNIDESREDWQKAVASAPSTLQTFEVHVRKGLPYSVEVSGTVTHLLESDLWGVGMHLKYALLEGYRFIPDLALRTGVSTVLGSREMSLLISSSDVTISKTFGAGGLLSITPFLGYGFTYVRASTYVIGFFPTSAPQPAKFVIEEGPNPDDPTETIDPNNIYRHRGLLGIRVASVHASLALELAISDGIQTFTTRLGADF